MASAGKPVFLREFVVRDHCFTSMVSGSAGGTADTLSPSPLAIILPKASMACFASSLLQQNVSDDLESHPMPRFSLSFLH